MRIDVHAHLWDEPYLKCLERYGQVELGFCRGVGAGVEEADLVARFELMESAGVDLQILSAAPAFPTIADEGAAVEAARMVNDLYDGVGREHPGRFAAFAALPLPHVDRAVEETVRAIDELGMLGVTFPASVLGRTVADPAWDPIFAELDRRNSVLFIHPTGGGVASPLVVDHGMNWMLGALIEDTVAIGHLIAGGTPSRFPAMRVVLCHLGGAVPLLLRRMDNQYGFQTPEAPEPPSAAIARLWFDTVSHVHPAALRCAVDTFGADRLVLGTDFPFETGDVFRRAIDHIAESGLEPAAADAILDRNAADLIAMSVGGRSVAARGGRLG